MMTEAQIRDLIKKPMRATPEMFERVRTLEEVLGYSYLGDGFWDDGSVDPEGTF